MENENDSATVLDTIKELLEKSSELSIRHVNQRQQLSEKEFRAELATAHDEREAISVRLNHASKAFGDLRKEISRIAERLDSVEKSVNDLVTNPNRSHEK